MKKQGRNSNKNDDLRKQAENKLKKKTSGLKKLAGNDTARLIHELEVHQIELEMQNDELRRAQTELEESRNRYSDLYDFAPMGYFVLDKKGLLTGLNLTGASLLGVERGNLIGKSFAYFIDKDDKDKFYLYRRTVLGTQGGDICEIRLRKKDGTVFWAQLNSQAIRDSEDSISQLRIAVTDITKQKNVIEKLRISEDNYRTIFDSANDAIFVHDTESGKILSVNRKACEIFGYPQEEFEKLTVEDLSTGVSPYDQEHAMRWIRKAAKKGLQVFEWICKDNTGRKFWVEVNLKLAVILGKDRMLAIVRDITDRKEAEEALRLHEARLQILLELNKMTEASQEDILSFVREEVIKITQSEFAFIGFMNEDESIMKINSWSKTAMSQCAVIDKPMHFPIAEAGLWGDIIRQRKTIVVNDYAAENLKKGYPEGHVPIKRFLGVPVFDLNRIVAVAAVANKDKDYNELDIRAITSMMNDMWRLLKGKSSEKALLESEKKLSAVLTSISDGFLTLSRDLVITYFNRTAEELLGRKSEEVIGHHLFNEAFPEARGSVFEDKYKQALRENKPLAFEAYFPADPYKNWYDVRIYPYEDGLSVYFRVVTERKEAEEALSESENKHRTLLKNIPQKIFYKDLNSVYVLCNESYADDLKIKSHEIKGKTDYDFYPRELADKYRADDKRIMQSGETESIEERYVKNGQESIVHTFKSPVKDEKGNIIGIFGIFWDITERKRIEETLERSEERYALAQRAANIGCWDWDITTGKLVWSEQIEPMFGFGPGEFGATYEAFLDCVHPDDRQHVSGSVNACVEAGNNYAIEHRIIWPDGTIRWMSETGDVIRDERGKAIRMLGIVQDITKRKLFEQQIENLAKFPSENPNPVLRIAKNGVVLHANEASSSLLAEWSCKVGQTAPKNWCRIVSDVFASGSARRIEVEHTDRIFAFMIVPVVEADYVNLYGRDITETKKAQEVLRASEEQFRRAVLDSPLPIMIHAEDGEVLQISKVWTDLTGYTPEEIPTLSAWTERAYGDRKDIVKSRIDKIFDYDTRVEEGEYVICSKDGETLIWDFSSAPLGKLPDGRRLVISMATDITERKEIAARQELAGRILELLNQKSTRSVLIHDVIKLIKESTGFEAVGVRLHEGGDFPYFGVKGFPKDFIEDENYLCARNKEGEQIFDEKGHPVLSCMCGSVIIGHADPDLPFFTEGGSFWTNSTTELQSSGSLDTLQVPLRNRCNEAGYESVALIPLWSGYEIVGLLQLNDSRPGRFTLEMVHFFERIGASIGIALARIKAEENIHNLAKFPSEDPNPVLRIAQEGTVLYANAAGSELLKTWGCNIGEQVPEHWHQYVLRILKSGSNEEVETSCDNRVFSLIMAPVVEAGYVNTYGIDITERKHAEEDLRKYRQHLEELVETRTGELTRANRQLLQEIEARKGLEKEILNVSEQERRKIGQELHDSLGQQLTGVAFMTKVLEQKLSKKSLNEAADVAEIAQLVNQATHQARSLAKGLHPIDLETGTLMSSLQELAESTETLFGINCTFQCDKRIRVNNPEVAVHLYRITQEAITNAIKHGKAKNIQIYLTYDVNKSILTVRNDGIDFPKEFEARNTGMGLQIMDHRVDIIEGLLDIHKDPKGGTIMTCTFPINKQ